MVKIRIKTDYWEETERDTWIERIEKLNWLFAFLGTTNTIVLLISGPWQLALFNFIVGVGIPFLLIISKRTHDEDHHEQKR